MRKSYAKKVLFFAVVVALCFSLFAAKKSEKDTASFKQEGVTLHGAVLSAKESVQQLAKEAEKSKDIKWRVCVNDVYGTVKGLLASAARANSQLKSAAVLQKIDIMKSSLVLLRGLAESSEKAVADATACAGQVTMINTKTTTNVDENKKKSGGGKSVNDAMGVGFSGDLVAGRENGVIHDSGISDGAGSDAETQTDTPDNNGESPSMASEMTDMITSPDIVDASPTR
ncbi:hypothetical protein KAH37_04355 [bacterium]|nr:hypothetical protein [bacterium]